MKQRGISVSVIIPGACNLRGAMEDVRKALSKSFPGGFTVDTALCLGCFAGASHEAVELHEHDCIVACELCDRERPPSDDQTKETPPHDRVD